VTPEETRECFLYNAWANERLLDAVSALPPEELRRDLGSSFGSVHATLVHILSSEWLFLMRWNGVSPPERLRPEDFRDLASVRSRWAEVQAGQGQYLARLTPEALTGELGYVNTSGQPWRYRLWQVMQQVLTHSAYHRGQVTTMLRQLGRQPVETDVLTYYDELTLISQAAGRGAR
jgi:uncharacterized damage-inducible protein DinB